jgi:hypothetical protein
VLATLQHALQDLHKPASTQKARDLHALVEGAPSSMPSDTGTEARATALWRLVQSDLASIQNPDERAALRAALHLDPTNREPSIDARLALARERNEFGHQRPGRRPGYDALRRWWGDGVRRLGEHLQDSLRYLEDHPEKWDEFFTNVPRFRRPSPGAQPVFAELFVTTVFMKGRFVQRRITERLITAREDDVRFYTARALPEMDDASASVPVRALWGCKAERVPSAPGEPILTRLWFPHALRRGERHFFASEAIAGNLDTPRRAINVEVDHHGIAPGRRLHDSMPISGLTIRIIFDEEELPEAVWFYANVTERERYQRPSVEGDDRWLTLSPHGHAEHTFVTACQPLANYGVAIAWPGSSAV